MAEYSASKESSFLIGGGGGGYNINFTYDSKTKTNLMKLCLMKQLNIIKYKTGIYTSNCKFER